MNSPMFAQRTSGNSAKAPAEPYAACGAAHGLSLPFGNSRLWPSTELYYANFSSEGSATPIQQIQPIVSSNPKPSLPVFQDGIYPVITEALTVLGTVAINRELFRYG